MEAGEGTLYDFKAYAFKAPVGINPDKSRLLNAWYSLSNFLFLLLLLLLLYICFVFYLYIDPIIYNYFAEWYRYRESVTLTRHLYNFT